MVHCGVNAELRRSRDLAGLAPSGPCTTHQPLSFSLVESQSSNKAEAGTGEEPAIPVQAGQRNSDEAYFESAHGQDCIRALSFAGCHPPLLKPSAHTATGLLSRHHHRHLAPSAGLEGKNGADSDNIIQVFQGLQSQRSSTLPNLALGAAAASSHTGSLCRSRALSLKQLLGLDQLVQFRYLPGMSLYALDAVYAHPYRQFIIPNACRLPVAHACMATCAPALAILYVRPSCIPWQ